MKNFEGVKGREEGTKTFLQEIETFLFFFVFKLNTGTHERLAAGAAETGSKHCKKKEKQSQ
jgi:hypothetical protein